MAQLTFEAGKTYRTRLNRTAYVTKHHGTGVALPYHLWVTGSAVWAGVDGGFKFAGNRDQMLPGAIEDDADAGVEQPEPIEERERTTDLRQIHSRLNRQTERIEELSMKLADAMDSGKAQTIDLFRQLRGARDNARGIDVRIDKTVTELVERLDAMAIAIGGKADGGFAEDHYKRLVNHGERLANLQDRITELGATIAELMIFKRMNFPDNPAPTKATCGHPECGQCYPNPPKRTIKGGWVNVFSDRVTGRPFIGLFCESKAEADTFHSAYRIACIQIPDITEGEGL